MREFEYNGINYVIHKMERYNDTIYMCCVPKEEYLQNIPDNSMFYKYEDGMVKDIESVEELEIINKLF